MKTLKLILAFLFASTLITSCSKNNDSSIQNGNSTRLFGIFKVLNDETTIEMDGVIGSSSLKDFNNLEAAFPKVNKIKIVNCDGSKDDNVNLQLSAKVHKKGMNTYLMDDGTIASGGVDFFLAGVKRTKGTNTKIGVHSWADNTGKEATDFPVGHAYHLPYIQYYVSVGFTQQQAEDFYYFTINVAPSEKIHWMTEEEIIKYGVIKE